MIHNTKISIIVAIDERRGIGKDNKLLFKIPEDFKRMKELTSGHAIIMGRRTFDSIGRVLPDRTNFIISRDPRFKVDGAFMAYSLEDAIEKSIKYHVSSIKYDGKEKIPDTKYMIHNTENEVFIFGGGQIFKEALEKSLVDRLYLTVVKGDYGADTFFPDYTQFGFTKIIEKEEHEEEGYKYTFLTLEM